MTGRTSVDVVRGRVAAINVNHRFRELLGRYGQAPDPPRDSDTPTRPSMRQVAFYLLPGGGYWEEPHLGAKLAQPPHVAWQPRGALLADDERDNIARPPAGPYADAIATWNLAAVPGGGDW